MLKKKFNLVLLTHICAVMLLLLPVYALPFNKVDFQFVNGLWFDGEAFVKRNVYVNDGRFVRFEKEGTAITYTPRKIVDLKGAYVTPPFCEAHNHNLARMDVVERMRNQYLMDGVFYAAMLVNSPRQSALVRTLLNRPDSVDVVFANGPITGPNGLPVARLNGQFKRGAQPAYRSVEDLNDNFYFIVSSEAELVEKWPIILSFNPGVIKTMIRHSQNYKTQESKGLRPDLLPKLVEMARKQGLKVFVHLNSAEDFHVAVEAGVHAVAHLPGQLLPARIDPKDAETAAMKNVTVITTARLIEWAPKENQPKLRDAQIANLKLLMEKGVKLAVGSDNGPDSSVGEVKYLRNLGIFDNLTLLKMWTKNCACAVFPNRKVGELRSGYEASFLALKGNPLSDFDATARIKLRVKDGQILEPAKTSETPNKK